MSLRNALGITLIALLVVAAIAGCTDDTTPAPSGGESGTTGPAESTADLTLGTLPVEPGYAWDIARYEGIEPIPLQLSVEGPWTLTAGADWPVRTTEIVEAADVAGIEEFDEFDFVEKTTDAAGDSYYPRMIDDGWLLQMGSITSAAGAVTAEPYAEPMKVWPVTFEVGDEFVVLDGENFRIEATVLAQNTVTVPAGVIDDAYLLSFEFVPVTAGAISGTQYYILAPDVGFVAMFGASAGDEATGFTALDSASVLVTLPQKQ
jgi:hypothetical protein